jgi:RHS repeat-associated protein
VAELLTVSPRVYTRWENGDATPLFGTVVKIADILDVSLDELAGRKESSGEATIHNHELHRLYKKVDQLSDEDQKALVIVLDSLVKRSRVSKVEGAQANEVLAVPLLAAVVFADENTGASYNYAYAYNQAGRVAGQCMTMSQSSVGAIYTWDNQGRMTSLSYAVLPSNTTDLGPVNGYTYDAMGNLASFSQQCSDCGNYYPISANATYNQAGQVTSLNYGPYQETRSYNSLLQLTAMAGSFRYYNTSAMNMQYNYSATQNNGRILSSVDGVAGQTVSYTYDALNRLSSAATKPTDTAAWGQSYSYDGFGNLLAQVPTQGSAPQVYPAVDSTTNHVGSVDANGNPAGWNYTWDVENRLLSYTNSFSNATYTYTYDPWGKRIVANGIAYFYGTDGKPLATFGTETSGNGSIVALTGPTYFTYLWGELLAPTAAQLAPTDRLGSVRSVGGMPAVYFPWGQEQTSTPDGTVKFAGYWRDETGGGVDYADQRYYKANYGRFWTPDPGNAGELKNPTSLNRYTYVLDDPVNNHDPEGLCTVMLGGITQTPYTPGTESQQDVAEEIGAISAFGYAGGTLPPDLANVMAQGVGIPTGATLTALEAIALAAQNPGPIDIIAFSGGAASFTTAWGYLNADVKSRIESITYVAPGSSPTQSLQTGNPGTYIQVFDGSADFVDIALQLLGGSQPSSQNFYPTGSCGHDASCIFATYFDQIEFGQSGCQIGAGSVFGVAPLNIPVTPPAIFGPLSMILYWTLPPVPVVTSQIIYYL